MMSSDSASKLVIAIGLSYMFYVAFSGIWVVIKPRFKKASKHDE